MPRSISSSSTDSSLNHTIFDYSIMENLVDTRQNSLHFFQQPIFSSKRLKIDFFPNLLFHAVKFQKLHFIESIFNIYTDLVYQNSEYLLSCPFIYSDNKVVKPNILDFAVDLYIDAFNKQDKNSKSNYSQIIDKIINFGSKSYDINTMLFSNLIQKLNLYTENTNLYLLYKIILSIESKCFHQLLQEQYLTKYNIDLTEAAIKYSKDSRIFQEIISVYFFKFNIISCSSSLLNLSILSNKSDCHQYIREIKAKYSDDAGNQLFTLDIDDIINEIMQICINTKPKSKFISQIFQNLTQSEINIIFVSLEDNISYLLLKSISEENYQLLENIVKYISSCNYQNDILQSIASKLDLNRLYDLFKMSESKIMEDFCINLLNFDYQKTENYFFKITLESNDHQFDYFISYMKNLKHSNQLIENFLLSEQCEYISKYKKIKLYLFCLIGLKDSEISINLYNDSDVEEFIFNHIKNLVTNILSPNRPVHQILSEDIHLEDRKEINSHNLSILNIYFKIFCNNSKHFKSILRIKNQETDENLLHTLIKTNINGSNSLIKFIVQHFYCTKKIILDTNNSKTLVEIAEEHKNQEILDILKDELDKDKNTIKLHHLLQKTTIPLFKFELFYIRSLLTKGAEFKNTELVKKFLENSSSIKLVSLLAKKGTDLSRFNIKNQEYEFFLDSISSEAKLIQNYFEKFISKKKTFINILHDIIEGLKQAPEVDEAFRFSISKKILKSIDQYNQELIQSKPSGIISKFLFSRKISPLEKKIIISIAAKTIDYFYFKTSKSEIEKGKYSLRVILERMDQKPESQITK